jgi:heat shock protein HslJ
MTSSSCSRCGFIISFLILAGLLASCGSGATSVSPVEDPNLTESDWQLVSLNNKPVQADTMAVLAFGEASNVLGSTGCNLFAGTFAIGTGSELNFKPNVTTSFECPEPYLAQESAMLLVLSSSSNYTIEGDELIITNPDGERRGKFVKMEPLVLEGTNWTLDAFNDGQGAFVNVMEGTEITASFKADGEMSGSGGCNDYNTTYQVNGEKITIGPIISTRKACSDPEGVMEQEGKYLEALGFADSFRNFSIILNFFDGEGQILTSYLNSELQRSQ